jgi:hypothetical protein
VICEPACLAARLVFLAVSLTCRQTVSKQSRADCKQAKPGCRGLKVPSTKWRDTQSAVVASFQTSIDSNFCDRTKAGPNTFLDPPGLALTRAEPAGTYAVTAGADKQLVIWDVNAKSCVAKHALEAPACAVSWHPVRARPNPSSEPSWGMSPAQPTSPGWVDPIIAS